VLKLALLVVVVVTVALWLGETQLHSKAPPKPSPAELAQMEDMKAALRTSPRFALCAAKGKKLHWSEARVAACVRGTK
jgi:hypothetical protein